MTLLRQSNIIVAGLLLALQVGCSQSETTTGCDRLQRTIYSDPLATTELKASQISKAEAVYASRQQAVLADQLAQLPLVDKSLSAYRQNLVYLYRHDSDLGMQASAFIDINGNVVVAGSNRAAYEQVASQRLVLSQQVINQQAEISNYCDKQARGVRRQQ